MKKVAVVIPCRNEEHYIEKCIRSIINCDYDKDYLDIFVCDGESTDRTTEIVRQLVYEHKYIHLINNPEKTTPHALNLGIKHSDADIKIILGAHSEIYPAYVSECVKAFGNAPGIGCTGGILENIPENETAQMISLAMSSPFGVGNAHFRTALKDGYVDTVAFGAYKKEVFEQAGFFDEELVRNQDDEFNFRLITAGFKIYLSKAIRAKYYVRASFRKLSRQYYQYGYWKVYVNRKHRTVTTLRQLVPPLFSLFLCCGLACLPFSKTAGLIFGLVLFFYFAAGLFFALQKDRKPIRVAGILLSFFILHLCYGFGYLEGIIHFMVFKNKPKQDKMKLSR